MLFAHQFWAVAGAYHLEPSSSNWGGATAFSQVDLFLEYDIISHASYPPPSWTNEKIFLLYCLPRSQTSLSLRKGWARKGWREGERMRDVWQILFSRWRSFQWRMITQFSKRSIDLFVLRILKEKWFFLIHCAKRKLFSYNWTGYSIITGFANDLYDLSMPKNYPRNPPLIC